jgi:hypothetical protein
MEPTSSDHGCASFRDDLAVFAVGASTGHDRARVLAHLETCPQCAAKLEELSATADALTTLIPDATPPEGFAERTMALVRAERRVPERRLARRVAAVAAVVVTLALGAGVGEAVATSQGGGPAMAVRSAALYSTRGTEGSVVLVSAGQTGWMVMTLQGAPTTGTVTCSIVLADGTRRDVGRFSVADGYGSWTAMLPVPATSVRAVSVVDNSGAMVAAAQVG